MRPNSLITAASLVFALVLGSYFVLSPIAKHETDLRLAHIGNAQPRAVSAVKQNAAATTSSEAQKDAVRD